jgi:hypothetical protein
MTFTTMTASDSAWPHVLSRVPHDVYHLPGYARVCATHEPWEVKLAVAEGEGHILVMPFMLRDLPSELPDAQGLQDVTVPYGYPGPVCSSPEQDVQRNLFGRLLDGFAEMDAVTVFVRCHATLGINTEALRPFGEVVVHGHTVFVDLANLPDLPVSSFRPDHRRNIRILREKGFELAFDRETDWAAFVDEYRATMSRLSSNPYYMFPNEYFDAMRTELADHVHLVAAIAPSGEPAAMALTFVCGEMAQYHLSGSNGDYLKLAPSKLAVLGMVELDRDLGATTLNLGGGLGGTDDNLFKFKAGFSKCTQPFATGRFVLDAERYAALSTDSNPPAGFFPAYRHGL